jgi:hypothetical protein
MLRSEGRQGTAALISASCCHASIEISACSMCVRARAQQAARTWPLLRASSLQHAGPGGGGGLAGRGCSPLTWCCFQGDRFIIKLMSGRQP